jgi:hypothetical protein
MPTFIEKILSGWTDITQLATGQDHTVGLKSDGTVVAVGCNQMGQCNTYDWDLQVNSAPGADAGDNITTSSKDMIISVVHGTGTDEDPGDLLEYRWLEGGVVLLGWTPSAVDGDCPLDLSTLSLPVGTHTLTLEVSDGKSRASDEMILIIENSPPHPVATGGGHYPIGSSVALAGQVSDFDGDTLTYVWKEGETVLCSGTVETVLGGEPVDLSPACLVDGLDLGDHTFTLEVSDGANPPVLSATTATIFDDERPSLAPVADKTILWPPNHKMVQVKIAANASDNSNLPVVLGVSIASNEPVDSLGDGDMAPDWAEPIVDQATGLITVQLRAERSGRGDGREYCISITATDSSGNSSYANVKIIVPHDQKK